MKPKINQLIKKHGQLYSEQLKINLDYSKKESEIFKWFLASLLFGKPIREEQAMNTFRLFMVEKLNTPDRILAAGWDFLVQILDLGGYVRYDFSTATKLLNIMKELKKKYQGKLTNIHKKAKNSKDLENLLQEFKGIGPITVNIFLRELRHIWPKANPEPSQLVKDTAKKLNINLNKFNKKTKKFIKLECALFRIGKHKEVI